ncbi:MAG TPA: FadR/GntR family transcriptional regulator [Candidatus Dormibacteraeota bacterium]|nr:FadR/GntR family transcriptional regulator [Candidatus Dormibacteraeota bacterium]
MGLASSSALRPVERSRLYEDLAGRLSEYVREAGMAVGDRFPPERELARLLGVSRTSVRQALVVLQVQGFLEIRHGDGVYLRRARDFGESLQRMLERRRRLPEVLEAREALECKLAELAAARRTSADLRAMRTALRIMESEVKADKLGLDGDATFHHAIAVAARNRVLVRLIDEMAEAIKETRIESLSEPGRPPRSLAAHRRILAAIETAQPEVAARAMRAHLREVADVSLLRWQPPEREDGQASS